MDNGGMRTEGRVMSPNFYVTPRPEDPTRALLSLWLGSVKVSAPVTNDEIKELADVLREFLKGAEVKT
jgi:hypothetical protein